MRRALLWAGLALSAPCVVLLVALPVGFVMELGKQIRLRVVNETGRPLRVTLVGAERVAALTLHPLVPLPAARAVDLPLAPGATRVLHYSGRRIPPRALALREADGTLFELELPPAAARRDVETGRQIVLDASTPGHPASPATAALLDGHPQAYPWAVLLAAPLGTLAFVRLRRALRAA